MQKFSPVGMMLDFAYGRETANTKPSVTKLNQARATSSTNTTVPMQLLAAASQAWWESRRPQGWTLEQHLADPTAGCNSTEEERALAEAVARWTWQGN
jgi:hypothetical protein